MVAPNRWNYCLSHRDSARRRRSWSSTWTRRILGTPIEALRYLRISRRRRRRLGPRRPRTFVSATRRLGWHRWQRGASTWNRRSTIRRRRTIHHTRSLVHLPSRVSTRNRKPAGGNAAGTMPNRGRRTRRKGQTKFQVTDPLLAQPRSGASSHRVRSAVGRAKFGMNDGGGRRRFKHRVRHFAVALRRSRDFHDG